MVADGERAARKRVEDLAEGPGADGKKPSFTQDAVQQHGPGDVAVPILAHDPDARTLLHRLVQERGTGVVELAYEPAQVAAGGTEALGVVIEVGQIDEREVRMFGSQDLRRASGDPFRAGQSRP